MSSRIMLLATWGICLTLAACSNKPVVDVPCSELAVRAESETIGAQVTLDNLDLASIGGEPRSNAKIGIDAVQRAQQRMKELADHRQGY